MPRSHSKMTVRWSIWLRWNQCHRCIVVAWLDSQCIEKWSESELFYFVYTVCSMYKQIGYERYHPRNKIKISVCLRCVASTLCMINMWHTAYRICKQIWNMLHVNAQCKWSQRLCQCYDTMTVMEYLPMCLMIITFLLHWATVKIWLAHCCQLVIQLGCAKFLPHFKCLIRNLQRAHYTLQLLVWLNDSMGLLN